MRFDKKLLLEKESENHVAYSGIWHCRELKMDKLNGGKIGLCPTSSDFRAHDANNLKSLSFQTAIKVGCVWETVNC